MTRVEKLNAITNIQNELARDKIDSRHVPRRAAKSRGAYLREPGGLPTEYLQDATDDSLATFLEHLEGVRPRVEAKDSLSDALLASFVLTDDEIEAQYKKFKKGRKKG